MLSELKNNLKSWTQEKTREGSLLFTNNEEVDSILEDCSTVAELQSLEELMLKNLRLENLGSKSKIWHKAIR